MLPVIDSPDTDSTRTPMARPPKPMPLYADALTDSVARGDMAAVRAHFDKVLWGDSE
jgi:hypothetical protein